MKSGDIPILQKIYETHGKDEADDPKFPHGYIGGFVITDDDDKIVMGGGVKLIAESVIVTDKTCNPHLLGDALLHALGYSIHVCRYAKVDELHAFVKNEAFAKHLLKHGFSPRQSSYFLRVTNNGRK